MKIGETSELGGMGIEITFITDKGKTTIDAFLKDFYGHLYTQTNIGIFSNYFDKRWERKGYLSLFGFLLRSSNSE